MEHSQLRLDVGKDMNVLNRTSTAMAIRVICHADGTAFSVVLAPGAKATVTGGTGRISVHIDDADPNFSGIELVRDDTGP